MRYRAPDKLLNGKPSVLPTFPNEHVIKTLYNESLSRGSNSHFAVTPVF